VETPACTLVYAGLHQLCGPMLDHARLPADDQDPALPGPHIGHQLIQQLAFAAAAMQSAPWSDVALSWLVPGMMLTSIHT
jgi:hypothetical protein